MQYLFPDLERKYEEICLIDTLDPSTSDPAIRSRYEDIQNYLMGEWALCGTGSVRKRYELPMREFLVRLPEEAFHVLIDETNFYFEDPTLQAVGVNVRNRCIREPSSGKEFECFTIIIFKAAYYFDDEAIIGLIAHEFAHSFVDDPDHSENERLTNLKLAEWGYDSFYKSLMDEYQKTKNHSGNV